MLVDFNEMAISDFRQPQFSEDIAWLPAWLQPNQEPLLDENIKVIQTPTQQSCKDLVHPQKSFNGREDVNSSGEDARYKSCHLFLSGSDNSPTGVTSSSGNVLHLHLHLSSNGTISQYTPSLVCDTLSKDGSNDIPSVELIPKTSTYGVDVKDGMFGGQLGSKSNFFTSKSQSVTKDSRHSVKKHQEKAGGQKLMSVDGRDATELSIAASEALVISEIVKSESAFKVCLASTVLELALHLKQTRNHWCSNGWEDVSDCKADPVDETDLLDNLDEDVMADAYGDVGLSISSVVSSVEDLCDSTSVIKQRCTLSRSVSRVPDTPVSENQYECDTGIHSAGRKAQEVEFEDMLQDTLTGHPHLVLNTGSAERHLEPYLYMSAQTNSQVAPTQGVNYVLENGTSSQTQDLHTLEGTVSSHPVQVPVNDRAENEIVHVVSHRFRSRWLGGWTGKGGEDVGASQGMDPNKNKVVPKFFTKETSFISESADMFPDQSSFVNRLESQVYAASLSSVVCEDLSNARNQGILLSQDFVTSSSMSLVDPVCSVIPCSISSDNTDITLGTNKKYIEEEAGKFLHSTLEHGQDNSLERTTRLCHGQESVSKMTGKGFGTASRKQLTSLQSYSRILLPQNAHLNREVALPNGSIPMTGILDLNSSEENIHSFKSSSRKSSPALLFSEPTYVCSSGNDHVKRQAICSAAMPVMKLKIQKKHSDETATDEADLQLQSRQTGCSPLIVSYETCSRLQASKAIGDNVIGDGSSDRDSIAEIINGKNLVGRVDKSVIVPLPTLHSGKHPNPCDKQGPSEKRVRFSENHLQQRTDQEMQLVIQTRSNTKNGKRLKISGLQPNLRSQKDGTCVQNMQIRDRKRMILQGLEFFLTGLRSKRERELEVLIRKHGGFVVRDVPPPPLSGRYQRSRSKRQKLPIFLSPKKLQTAKFLYGCALNAFLLKVNWLIESIAAGSLLPPEKYMLMPNRDDMNPQITGWPIHYANCAFIFDRVGIMIYAKHRSCTKLEKIVKHGGGQVFKTLQWLVKSLNNRKISVGVVVAEDESRASRHLKQCAFEHELAVMPVSWIIDSLHTGKLIPFKKNNPSFPSLKIKIPEFVNTMELSPEI